MSIEVWFSFVAAALVLCFTPGPTVLVVIGQSLQHGKRSVLPLLAGALLGDVVAMTLSLMGVGVMLQASAAAFTVFKFLCAAYLVFMGVKSWRSKPKAAVHGDDKARPGGAIFRQTFLVTALNPKGIIFFLAFFPLFINPALPALPQMFMLGGTFLLVSALGVTFYAFSAGCLGASLFSDGKRSEKIRRMVNRVSGGMLISAGVATATMRLSD